MLVLVTRWVRFEPVSRFVCELVEEGLMLTINAQAVPYSKIVNSQQPIII